MNRVQENELKIVPQETKIIAMQPIAQIQTIDLDRLLEAGNRFVGQAGDFDVQITREAIVIHISKG